MSKHWYVWSMVAMCVAAPALAQAPVRPPRPGEVASDPIRCWWKTDRTAVRVGEQFQLVLTCGVIEVGSTTVVPALNQLEPGALALTPFEVVSGVRREDIVAPPWRYVQFEYSARLLADGFFGQDLNIPALTVTYNLQAPGGGSTGRDQTYVLPPLPMRVLSLVPRTASDIRDASGQTFESIESRRFRAQAARVASAIAFAFAGLLAIFAVVRVAGRYRGRTAAAARPLPQPSVLGACLRSLADVKEEAARTGGWTPELTRRALAPLRVAGAVALGKRVTQDVVGRDVARRDGQLVAHSGLLRRRRALLSAPTTSLATAAAGNGHRPSPSTVEPITEALRVFSQASYGRNGGTSASALDEALAGGTQAIRRLRTSTRWPMRTMGAVARAVTGMWS